MASCDSENEARNFNLKQTTFSRARNLLQPPKVAHRFINRNLPLNQLRHEGLDCASLCQLLASIHQAHKVVKTTVCCQQLETRFSELTPFT